MTILNAVRGLSTADDGHACVTCQRSDNGTRGSSCEDVDLFWCRIRNEVVADLINDKVKELKEMRG